MIYFLSGCCNFYCYFTVITYFQCLGSYGQFTVRIYFQFLWRCLQLVYSNIQILIKYLWWCLSLVHYHILLFQCLWRCHAAEPPFKSSATWKVHIEEKRHFDKHHPGFSKIMNHSMNKLNSKQNSNSMSRITQKSSLLKKRRGFSRSASISDRQGSCQSIPECPEKTSPDQICEFIIDLTY